MHAVAKIEPGAESFPVAFEFLFRMCETGGEGRWNRWNDDGREWFDRRLGFSWQRFCELDTAEYGVRYLGSYHLGPRIGS